MVTKKKAELSDQRRHICVLKLNSDMQAPKTPPEAQQSLIPIFYWDVPNLDEEQWCDYQHSDDVEHFHHAWKSPVLHFPIHPHYKSSLFWL